MGSDIRDQRVGELLKMKTKEDRLNQLFAWCVDERLDRHPGPAAAHEAPRAVYVAGTSSRPVSC